MNTQKTFKAVYISGEYKQNLCSNSDPNCIPCPQRLPSCVGVPNGDVGFTGKLWKPDYVTCYTDRTVIPTKTCSQGYFHPTLKMCTQNVNKSKYLVYITCLPLKLVIFCVNKYVFCLQALPIVIFCISSSFLAVSWNL